MNLFHTTIHMSSEVLAMVCSYLSTEVDVFLASQARRYWRGVLTSSPLLWTQLTCHRASRTITNLERCRAEQIQPEFDPESSSAALENALRHGNEIIHCWGQPAVISVFYLRSGQDSFSAFRT